MLKKIAIAVLLMFMSGCTDMTASVSNGEECQERSEIHRWGEQFKSDSISIYSLIVNAESENQRTILVFGILKVTGNEASLFSDQISYDYSITENAVSLEISGDMLREISHLSGRVVGVRGVFVSSNRGTYELFAGTIGNISLVRHDNNPNLQACVPA